MSLKQNNRERYDSFLYYMSSAISDVFKDFNFQEESENQADKEDLMSVIQWMEDHWFFDNHDEIESACGYGKSKTKKRRVVKSSFDLLNENDKQFIKGLVESDLEDVGNEIENYVYECEDLGELPEGVSTEDFFNVLMNYFNKLDVGYEPPIRSSKTSKKPILKKKKPVKSSIDYRINKEDIDMFEGLDWGYGIQPYHSLSEISRVDYISERYDDLLNQIGFDGGYVVELNDGIKEYYGWNYGYDDLTDITDLFNKKIKTFRKPIESARFIIEDENGEVIASADTYEEAETVGGVKIIDTQSQGY